MKDTQTQNGLEIAIIGMSGMFPNSPDHTVFWDNLKEGKTLMTTFSDDELLQRGVSHEQISDPNYVKTMSVLRGKELFDAGFFGYTVAEGKVIDPQVRLFMQQCWSALEDAGYTSAIENNRIGLFAGAAVNDNWRIYVRSLENEGLVDQHASKVISTHSFISTMVSHKLNLTGPSVFIDTACSTSLVAVHLACRSILTRECNMALAGGATVRTLIAKGYLYEEGLAFSKDGYTRSFDINSTGTGGGEGVGVVLLKRLTDAVKDRDHIYAVIKASAINNDGNRKVGYGAPSTQGQIDCIRYAQKLAKTDPREITYIEAHGTATNLGDPIEVSALNQAFNTGGKDKYCAIGSVKSNMGHSGIAAGVTGLIKTALSLKHQYLAPSLYFDGPNPKIDFDAGPFYVITKPEPWLRKNGNPLRAGVSAFGVGGTNAHVILEEALPVTEAPGIGKEEQVLTLSAKTNTSLKKYAEKLRTFLSNNPDTNLSNLSYTLAVCRKHFDHRYAAPFHSPEDLMNILDGDKISKMSVKAKENSLKIVFMFSGLGSQYPNMGKTLYENSHVFRTELDKGIEQAKQLTGKNFLEILFPKPGEKGQINEIRNVQPVIFIFEYALAKLMMHYGIEPSCMIGHSTGEYVAACIAGVFSFEDALKLVIRRGEMGTLLPPGAMLACSLNEEDARRYVNDKISLAAVNGSNQTILSGDPDAINELVETLQSRDISAVKLNSPVAGHSYMLDPYLEQFRSAFEGITLNAPAGKIVSCVTGDFLSPEKFASPDYWITHVRQSVLFYNGIQKILDEYDNPLFVEIGAGNTLTNMVKKTERDNASVKAVNLVRSPKERENDADYWAGKLGQIWMHGGKVKWDIKYPGGHCNKMPLPTYAFEENIFPCEVNPEIPDLQENHKQATYIETYGDMLSFRKTDGAGEKRRFLLISSANGLAENISAAAAGSIQKPDTLSPELLTAADINSNPAQPDMNDQSQISEKMKAAFNDKTPYTDIIFDLGDFITDGESPDGNLILNDERITPWLHRIHHTAGPELQRIFFLAKSGTGKMQLNEIACLLRTMLLLIFHDRETGFSLISDCNIQETRGGKALIKELLQPDVQRPWQITFKNGKKQTWQYQEISSGEADNADTGLKEKGTYLLLGGLTNPGFLLAKSLAERYHATLFIADNITEQEENGILPAIKQRRLQELQAAGHVSAFTGLKPGPAGIQTFIEEQLAGGTGFDGVIFIQPRGLYNDLSDSSVPVTCKKVYSIQQELAAITTSIDQLAQRREGFVWMASSLADYNGINGLSWDTVTANFFTSLARNEAESMRIRKYALLDENFFSEHETDKNTLPAPGAAGFLYNLFRLSLAAESGHLIVHSAIPPGPEGFKRKIKHTASVAARDIIAQMTDSVKRGRPDMVTPYQAAATPAEKKIRYLFETILNIDEVGVLDNFFELGGDSLQGMMLLKRINKEFDREFMIKDFFQDPCVRAIANAVDSTAEISEIEEGLNNEITI